MLVRDLSVGGLYRMSPGTIFRLQSGFVVSENLHIPNITICNIWRSYWSRHENPDAQDSVNAMIYLGWERTEWCVNGIHKHHWFLMDGNQIRIDGNHIKLLEEFDERSF